MTRPKLRKGDEFVTRNPMWLGRTITLVEKVKAVDDDAVFSHAGIVLDENGTTLESLWTVKSQNIWNAYQGKRVLIVRNMHMSEDVFTAGYDRIRKHVGQHYPFCRLVLHLLGLAKFIHWRRLVCSELVAKFEAGCADYLARTTNRYNTGFLRNWYGVNPDHLADRWLDSKHYKTVFHGIVPRANDALARIPGREAANPPEVDVVPPFTAPQPAGA